ncbi:MAG: nucleotidyltransferase domain-containing protein [Leptolyngbya sp. SIO1D8]|nr:nucleotidyltransferase domain-containing protein [Leptolyngbya sp. SIO1D8]
MVASNHQHTPQTNNFQACDLPKMEDVGTLSPRIKKLLWEFKQKLIALYGKRLVSLVLYGSVARHEETEESDMDVLVVLRDEMISHGDEIFRMADAGLAILLDYDELISVIPMAHNDFLYRNSPLLQNVRQEGILV